METMKAVLKKYNFPKRELPLNIDDKQLEEKTGFRLPEDYKYYLRHFLGFEAFIGKEFVRLWHYEELLDLNIGYCIFEYLPKTLGIGGNGGGEFIAIECFDSIRIVLSPFIDLDKEDHIEIGSSFSDFLQRIDNGEEWFK